MTRRRFLQRFLIGGTVLLIGDSFGYEPQNIELATWDVAIPGLPRRLDGFRVVQVSDLHRGPVTRDSVIRKAVAVANSARADAAVLTGDFISTSSDNLEPCLRMMSEVRTRLGSFAVMGNHDQYHHVLGLSRKLMPRYGITLLDNNSARLEDGLFLAGIDDVWGGRPDAAKALRHVESAAACVMVCHNPLGWGRFKGRTGLLITGHTHGGQVQLPLIPRNKLPGLRGWEFIEGWYRRGEILMYVNRGIGMVNPPARFLCRPEVTLFILHPSPDGRASVLRA